MSSGLMLDDIIMNLFTNFTKQTKDSVKKDFILQNPGWYNLFVQRIYAGLLTEKRISVTKKTLRSHHFIEKEKSRKYLSGIISIDIDETDL